MHSKDWPFIPDQWQVQKWAPVFEKIPLDHYYYFAPQLTKADGPGLPGINAATLTDSKEYSEVVKTLLQIIRERENGRALKIIWLSDGPYSIPYVK